MNLDEWLAQQRRRFTPSERIALYCGDGRTVHVATPYWPPLINQFRGLASWNPQTRTWWFSNVNLRSILTRIRDNGFHLTQTARMERVKSTGVDGTLDGIGILQRGRGGQTASTHTFSAALVELFGFPRSTDFEPITVSLWPGADDSEAIGLRFVHPSGRRRSIAGRVRYTYNAGFPEMLDVVGPFAEMLDIQPFTEEGSAPVPSAPVRPLAPLPASDGTVRRIRR